MDYETILQKLETGEVRAAIQDENGNWQANTEVKQAILAAFKAGRTLIAQETIMALLINIRFFLVSLIQLMVCVWFQVGHQFVVAPMSPVV
jgi:hypothetical protein